MLINLFPFFSRYSSRVVFIEFQAKPLKTEPSLPIKVDSICLSLILREESTLIFSITNLGSILPDPKGAKQLIYPKKSLKKLVEL